MSDFDSLEFSYIDVVDFGKYLEIQASDKDSISSIASEMLSMT